LTVDQAFECLKASHEIGRLGQAYLVVGSPREEGRELTEQVQQMLFCESGGGCGTCRTCLQVAAHTHSDILWIEPQKRSRIISIEQVRSLQGLVFHTSLEGGWKSCVLVGADRLSTEAGNAFLKTLEEPPPRSIFFLLSEAPQFLLPTTVSRCQKISVYRSERVLPDDWAKRLIEILSDESAGYEVESFAMAARVQKVMEDLKEVAEAEEQERAGAEAQDEERETMDARASSRYREMRMELMRSVLLWYRDILLLVCGADEKLLCFGKWDEALRSKAAGLDYRRAKRNVEIVEEMYRQMERNVTEAPVLASGFSRLS